MSLSKYFRFAPVLVLLWCTAQAAGTAQNYAELSTQRIAEIASKLAAQPAGLGPSCNDRQAWTAQTAAARLSEPLRTAEKMLTSAFPPWDDEAYLEYSRNGVRTNGERMMNTRKAWLYPLVMAECIEAKGRFVATVEKTLTEWSNQPAWTWPAHDKGLRNFKDKNYEVDLLSADIAHDMAQALYLLGDRINPSVRKTALDALEKRVFTPVRNTLITGKDNTWIKREGNWNLVCLAGVVSAALAVLPDRNDRAVFAAAAEHYVKLYISGFDADGYSTEGPGYWNYGFSHFVQLREALNIATSGKLDLFTDPKTRAMALYGYRIEMLPGNTAAFGDAPPSVAMNDVTRAYANQAFAFKQSQSLKSLPITRLPTGNASAFATAELLLFANPARTALAEGAPVQAELHSYFDNARARVTPKSNRDASRFHQGGW
jgi:hypothetical protein